MCQVSPIRDTTGPLSYKSTTFKLSDSILWWAIVTYIHRLNAWITNTDYALADVMDVRKKWMPPPPSYSYYVAFVDN